MCAVLSVNLILSACGGGGVGGGGGTAADYISANGTQYTEDGQNTLVEGYLDQTSPDAYQFGGAVGYVLAYDVQSGNAFYFRVVSTVDGWPGVYYLSGFGEGNSAMITVPALPTSSTVMQDFANGSGTGGSITIGSFGNVGQPITGSYNVNLCDPLLCSSSIKSYTGTFRATRIANYGSIGMPTFLTPHSPPMTLPGAISPVNGKNYYVVGGNPSGGTLTLTLTPTVDVDLAVFTDAGFTVPATCDITSNLNVVGNGVETCTITVAATKRMYLTVSQAAAATAVETYDLTVAKN